MFFKKMTTYEKIKFPQQANSMVGGTRLRQFFWQIKPNIKLALKYILALQFRKTLFQLLFTILSIYSRIPLRRTLKGGGGVRKWSDLTNVRVNEYSELSESPDKSDLRKKSYLSRFWKLN